MNFGTLYEDLKCRQILTSRGTPTVEIDLHLSIGTFRTSCPAGKSTGALEAVFITDPNSKEYNGLSVTRALFNITNIIKPRLKEILFTKITDQKELDEFLINTDGTGNKKRIGVNAILPLSLAFCRAGAVCLDMPLRKYISQIGNTPMSIPKPFFNVLNGGLHSGNNFAIQEVMVGFFHNDYSQNLQSGVVFFNCLKNIISKKYGSIYTSTGDEGGFTPPLETLDEALELIMAAYQISGLDNMKIAIDAAATTFHTKQNTYDLSLGKRPETAMNGSKLGDMYLEMVNKYPLLHIIEDPFAETDYESWKNFMSRIVDKKIIVIGDDLTVTNPKLVERAGDSGWCNGLLVKINQIGTVSETLEAVKMARNKGMKIMVSHRSAETEDTFIADFSVGIGADFIKSGAPNRGERICKYNQLLRIHESMNHKKS